MKISTSRLLTAFMATAALCGGSTASAQLAAGFGTDQATDPRLINISGATLFENFFTSPASTNDFLDVDGDGIFAGVTADNLSPTINPASIPSRSPGDDNLWWGVNYRATGSGNGLAELVNFGSATVTTADGVDLSSSNDAAYLNRTQYIDSDLATSLFGIGNAANPGGSPVRADPTTREIVQGSTSAPNGVQIDMAVLDVPTRWFVTNTAAGPNTVAKNPGTAGYGDSDRLALNVDGTVTTQNNKLKSLGGLNLAADGASIGTTGNDTSSVYDTQVAFVPIAVITNPGVGKEEINRSDLQHSTVTGRLKSGENLVQVTRDSGSGTRNGYVISLGVDPSEGAGENVGVKNSDGTRFDILGDEFLPSNKGGSSRMEQTVRNHRLAIGYTGAERGIGRWLDSGQLEILGVIDDTNGGTVAVRPTATAVTNNGGVNTGYRIGGPETFSTIGDPKAGWVDYDRDGLVDVTTTGGGIVIDPTKGEWYGIAENGAASLIGQGFDSDDDGVQDGTISAGDIAATVEGMDNPAARDYLRNILAATASYQSPGGTTEDFFSPGQFLGQRFIPTAALDNVQSLTDPDNFIANTETVLEVQNDVKSSNTLANPLYASFDSSITGVNPTRKTGAVYSDGVAGGANYVDQAGNVVAYGTALSERNKIAGDFDGDGDRDVNDVDDMIAAYNERQGGPAWVAPTGTGSIAGASGSDAVIEILGDFTGDGNFDEQDIRYWADGLVLTGGTLDREAGFAAVDNASLAAGGDLNFFGTVKATGDPTRGSGGSGEIGVLKSYVAGDSRGDIAGPNGLVTPGYNPIGADGRIDEHDIDYLFSLFSDTSLYGTDGAQWDNLDEARFTDLSGDMNGDLVIDLADVTVLVQDILGTNFGDANLDRVVDIDDFNTVASNFDLTGTNIGWAQGDFNGDLVVNIDDFNILASVFDVEEFTTPEPGTLSLVAASGLLLGRRRRRA